MPRYCFYVLLMMSPSCFRASATEETFKNELIFNGRTQRIRETGDQVLLATPFVSNHQPVILTFSEEEKIKGMPEHSLLIMLCIDYALANYR